MLVGIPARHRSGSDTPMDVSSFKAAMTEVASANTPMAIHPSLRRGKLV
jgi:hypothetical protein